MKFRLFLFVPFFILNRLNSSIQKRKSKKQIASLTQNVQIFLNFTYEIFFLQEKLKNLNWTRKKENYPIKENLIQFLFQKTKCEFLKIYRRSGRERRKRIFFAKLKNVIFSPVENHSSLLTFSRILLYTTIHTNKNWLDHKQTSDGYPIKIKICRMHAHR